MDKVGIYTNKQKDPGLKITLQTVESVKKNGFEPVFLARQVDKKFLPEVKRLDAKAFFTQTKCIIVIGGDGTLLSVARRAAPYHTPLFGINAGRLGFLTEGDKDKNGDLIDKLLSGDVIEDNRIMLNCKFLLSGGREKDFLALNDVVIKSKKLNLIRIKVKAGDSLVEDFRADGLIISTPTGSTAYSLAASGPIVHPDSNVIIINPICPQNLNNRPFILPDNQPIEVSFSKNATDLIASMDGQDNINLDGKDALIVTVSKYQTNLLRLKNSSYFERIRSKLYDI